MKNIVSLMLLTLSVIILLYYFSFITTVESQIKINNNGEYEYIKLEDYLVGVVACEMPASYPIESLKAQAIASRTYALYKVNNNMELLTTIDDQCYIDDAAMHEKWGSDYLKYKTIIEESVSATKGLVAKKNNELFKTFYFSTSNGYTEPSQEIFKEGELLSVSSLFDASSKNFTKETTFKKADLINMLGNFNSIKINARNNTNHVTEVLVDNKLYSGVEFRHLLNLRSTDFEISINNDEYTFKTFGYGHGVGMSQYGASILAKNGLTFDEILRYYYGDITLEKL